MRPAESGIPQGSRLGPLLFGAAFDSVLATRLPGRNRLQAYADDLLLLGPRGNPTESTEFHAALSAVAEATAALGMELNRRKNQLLNISLRQLDLGLLHLQAAIRLAGRQRDAGAVNEQLAGGTSLP